jgi:hypothetical protein
LRGADQQWIDLAVYVRDFSLKMNRDKRNVMIQVNCETEDNGTLFQASNMAGTRVASSCVIRGCSEDRVSERLVDWMIRVQFIFQS